MRNCKLQGGNTTNQILGKPMMYWRCLDTSLNNWAVDRSSGLQLTEKHHHRSAVITQSKVNMNSFVHLSGCAHPYLNRPLYDRTISWIFASLCIPPPAKIPSTFITF